MTATATESSARIRTSPLNNTASHCLVALHRVSFVPLLWHFLTMSPVLGLGHLHWITQPAIAWLHYTVCLLFHCYGIPWQWMSPVPGLRHFHWITQPATAWLHYTVCLLFHCYGIPRRWVQALELGHFHWITQPAIAWLHYTLYLLFYCHGIHWHWVQALELGCNE